MQDESRQSNAMSTWLNRLGQILAALGGIGWFVAVSMNDGDTVRSLAKWVLTVGVVLFVLGLLSEVVAGALDSRRSRD